MLIRTFIAATVMLLSGCGSDPVSSVSSSTQINAAQDQNTPQFEDTVGGAAIDNENTETGDDTTDEDPTVNELVDIAELLGPSDVEYTTASGLTYQILTPTEGPNPTAQSIVTLHYVGALMDGTVFDSSYLRGEPATFALLNTIDGFKEGVQLMSVGSWYRFTMPSNIAYGEQSVGEFIGPNETLVFEVILLEINS